MSQEQLIDLETKQLGLLKKIIKQHMPDKTVWAYGSRVTWKASTTSDIDLAVFGCNSMEIDTLKEALEESDLLISVDIMNWEEIPEKFKTKIKQKYVVLHETSKLEGWREVKLGDAPIIIIDGDRGKNYPKKKDFSNQGYCLFLNTKNVTESGFSFSELNFITKEKNETLGKGELKRKDTVLTTRGTIGNVVFYNKKVPYENIRINSGMVIIRPIGINEIFNYYLFKHLNSVFFNFSSGSAQPQLPIRDLKEISVLLPPLPEQKAIAEVLSSLDDKIDLLHRQNKTLEDMAQTLFRQWFIEEADEGWEIGKLGDVVEISSGKSLKRSEHNPTGEYPILGANGEIGRTNNYFSDEKIIFTGRVGTLGNIFISATKAWLSDNTLIINPTKNHFYYVYYALKNMYLKNLNVGSTQPLIRQSDLKNIELLLPAENILCEFERKMDAFFVKIQHNNSQISTLENLRDTLLPKLMSGRIRIRN